MLYIEIFRNKICLNQVLVNRSGGLSLPRKSVVRLTDRPDMTLDVYRGRKTTQQQQQPHLGDLQVSQYIVSVEFSYLIVHISDSSFICFSCYDSLMNFSFQLNN